MAEYIERETTETAISDIINRSGTEAEILTEVHFLPAAEVVSKAQYDELLKAAKKMHEWIFLNTIDEQEVYEKLGLTEEMNALLGHGGTFRLTMDGPKPVTYDILHEEGGWNLQ